jgi:hypothetical protein
MFSKMQTIAAAKKRSRRLQDLAENFRAKRLKQSQFTKPFVSKPNIIHSDSCAFVLSSFFIVCLGIWKVMHARRLNHGKAISVFKENLLSRMFVIWFAPRAPFCTKNVLTYLAYRF